MQFDRVGSSVVAFSATECFHSHDGYQMKYSIGYRYHFKHIGSGSGKNIKDKINVSVLHAVSARFIARKTIEPK